MLVSVLAKLKNKSFWAGIATATVSYTHLTLPTTSRV